MKLGNVVFRFCGGLVLGFVGAVQALAAPNVLLICVDDLRPELGCYGVSHARTPNIDRLASEGRIFTRHYVQAPTCGASRFTLLTGLYGPRDNDALLRRAANPETRKPSMPEVFRAAGFTTVAVGKISHHPGGLAGTNWNDPAKVEMPDAWDRQPLPCGPWLHPEGMMHGLANGAIRGKKAYPACQAVDGPDTTYPDGLITDAALKEMGQLATAEKPFFLAVGLIRPHLPFGMPKRWFDMNASTQLPAVPHPDKPSGISTWHISGEFFRYDHGGLDPRKDADYSDKVRRHYAACVSYADAQAGRLLDGLKKLSLDQNTIVVLWGDHGWHLGEHGVWGKHTLFEESLRSPLIVRAPGMASPGLASPAVVETIDVFPTLCGLAGIKVPGYLQGTSLQPQLRAPETPGRVAVSYGPAAETIRTDRYRLIRHRSKDKPGAIELYDHQSPEGETRNLADGKAELVRTLSETLDRRMKSQGNSP